MDHFEKLGWRLSKIPEKYQVPLLRLSNAQHFFRVIGDIVVEDFARGIFQMTPPYDFNQKTAGIPTIRCELPKPKETHPMIRKVFLDRGRVLPSLVEFLHRHPEILHHLFSDGVIPGEQADEVEAFNHSQAMEAYNTAEARGENVTKPQKSKKMKAKNPTSIAVPTALPFPANRGSPGNMTANRFGPVNPFPSSHNQQGGIASATAQSQFGHFTARTNTNPVLGNQNLDIGNQRKGSIVLYEHRYGEFIK